MRNRWRILVVADSASGEWQAERLRRGGHVVDLARSGMEALQLARQNLYPLYLVEFETPEIEGLEVITAIRNIQPDASVMVTSRGRGMSVDDFTTMAQKLLAEADGGAAIMSLAAMEKHLILSVLEHTGGNIRESASILGIDRSTLYEKIKKYSLPRMKPRPRSSVDGSPVAGPVAG
jgi:DNA-binding NtrC family response regulator